jgi:hypothetical protein
LQEDEELDHLLVGCAYIREVWFLSLHRFGWETLVLMVLEALASWWI